jgi:hypothetical protein
MVAALTGCCFFFRRGTSAAWLRHLSIHPSKTPTTTIYHSTHLVVRQKTGSTCAVAKIPPSTTPTSTFGDVISPPQRIPYSLVLKLRQQVMWPDQPLEYSSVEGDEEESTLHFGIYVTCPSSSSSSSSLLLPINAELPMSSSSSSSSSSKDEPIQSKTLRLCSVVSVWINADRTDAQFRKFCTDTAWQGQGLGTSLLRYTFQELLLGRNNNNNNNNNSNNNYTTKATSTTAITTSSSSIQRIWCNARLEQCHFYAKPPFDMVPIKGSEFVKGGRDYRLMERVCVCDTSSV